MSTRDKIYVKEKTICNHRVWYIINVVWQNGNEILCFWRFVFIRWQNDNIYWWKLTVIMFFTYRSIKKKKKMIIILPQSYFRYKPTRLWGFSGHVQTVVHSIIGRVRCPWPIGERVYIGLSDDTTLTYDLYQPLTNGHEGSFISSFLVISLHRSIILI